MNIASKAIIALGLVAAAAFAHASGWVAVLKNTPAELFDDDDLRLFLATAAAVLNADGQPVKTAWSNPATGAGGDFLVIGQSVDANKAACKRVRFSVSAKERASRQLVWTACKDTSGRWRLSHVG